MQMYVCTVRTESYLNAVHLPHAKPGWSCQTLAQIHDMCICGRMCETSDYAKSSDVVCHHDQSAVLLPQSISHPGTFTKIPTEKT